MKIALFGAGNVAGHFYTSFREAGHQIVQVYVRTAEKALIFPDIHAEQITSNLSHITDDADVYFICVKDDAIKEIAFALRYKKGLKVHCSGTVPLQIFKDLCDNGAVYYPLQTFSISIPLHEKKFPILAETMRPADFETLRQIAASTGNQIIPTDSEIRKHIHLAAVLACNFSNLMYTKAREIMQRENIDFNLILPLIKETVYKLDHVNPYEAQTGPARRYDVKTLLEHEAMINDDQPLRLLYQLMSEMLIKMYRK